MIKDLTFRHRTVCNKNGEGPARSAALGDTSQEFGLKPKMTILKATPDSKSWLIAWREVICISCEKCCKSFAICF